MHLQYTNGRVPRYTQEGGTGYAYVDFFPGDSEIAVVNGVYVPMKDRGKGIGSRQHVERLKLMRELGIGYALCTSNNANGAEIRILEKNGWERLRVLDYVTLWFKDLRAGEEEVINVEPE